VTQHLTRTKSCFRYVKGETDHVKTKSSLAPDAPASGATKQNGLDKLLCCHSDGLRRAVATWCRPCFRDGVLRAAATASSVLLGWLLPSDRSLRPVGCPLVPPLMFPPTPFSVPLLRLPQLTRRPGAGSHEAGAQQLLQTKNCTQRPN
jgi:hypothetical protein